VLKQIPSEKRERVAQLLSTGLGNDPTFLSLLAFLGEVRSARAKR
jgi:hypothetical protein